MPGSGCCGAKPEPTRRRRSASTKATVSNPAAGSAIMPTCRRIGSSPAYFTKNRCSSPILFACGEGLEASSHALISLSPSCLRGESLRLLRQRDEDAVPIGARWVGGEIGEALFVQIIERLQPAIAAAALAERRARPGPIPRPIALEHHGVMFRQLGEALCRAIRPITEQRIDPHCLLLARDRDPVEFERRPGGRRFPRRLAD